MLGRKQRELDLAVVAFPELSPVQQAQILRIQVYRVTAVSSWMSR